MSNKIIVLKIELYEFLREKSEFKDKYFLKENLQIEITNIIIKIKL